MNSLTCAKHVTPTIYRINVSFPKNVFEVVLPLPFRHFEIATLNYHLIDVIENLETSHFYSMDQKTEVNLHCIYIQNKSLSMSLIVGGTV